MILISNEVKNLKKMPDKNLSGIFFLSYSNDNAAYLHNRSD
ncbi:hypothetical protein AQPE_4200 [Aquipluma nitroreducens]|uniref:Uncharacterized protein n=1 Tax=Aquipluma nitroreducens TaxID=2010828 RepID=A0A5K7SEV2_9BACT|nr:hypothetical protein AQPE_4200 [Aquipluma nitroreducens]